MRKLLLLLSFILGMNAQAQDMECPVWIRDSDFVNIRDWNNDFVYDMKYATNDNFLKAKVYDCAECYLRWNTAQALIKANKALMKKGYRIKLYDCYRPLTIQKRMWAIVPNPKYVADPAKGSIHNRGGAVDITLVDKNGKELDMGTAFDHFGPEAAHEFAGLSDQVKKNRALLKKIMKKYGFKPFDSEWWHYNFKDATSFKVADFVWKCP
jgi:D-alanyl-D-alanine dipeptidase